jgi:hypothetical protein
VNDEELNLLEYELHGIISQKIELLIINAMRISNPTLDDKVL